MKNLQKLRDSLTPLEKRMVATHTKTNLGMVRERILSKAAAAKPNEFAVWLVAGGQYFCVETPELLSQDEAEWHRIMLGKALARVVEGEENPKTLQWNGELV